MHDTPQDFWLRKRNLQDRLVELIGSYGYRYLETPILESTELFLRKAGGELASRMYSFTDAGSNHVSLRPEFTSPIVRHYLEHAQDIALPARWQYAGPVFRYDDGDQGSGQFTQVGAELLGSSNVMADVELLGLAAHVPSQLGLTGCQIRVADLDVVHSVLDAVGVSERARTFIMSSVSQLKEGRPTVPGLLERARHLHVAVQETPDDALGQAIDGLDDAQSRKVLHGLLDWTAADQFGQRDPDEVVERLLRKLRGGDDLAVLERALNLISDLAGISGEPSASVSALRSVIAEAGANMAAVDRFEEFLNLVQTDPAVAENLVVDLGLVRGLAYYNGLVFEVTHPQSGTPLAGGGRYDGLARALGSPEPLPALGFAYTLETLLEVMEEPHNGSGGASDASGALVLADGADSYRSALQAAADLRSQGIQTELDVCGRDLSQGLVYASKMGMAQVIVVSKDGQQTAHAAEPERR
jgi:histidyl-tRNA synthetase